MPLDKSVLDLLVCPETREPLAEADAALLDKLNAAISLGERKSRGGVALTEPIHEGLVRADGKFLYPISKEGIPNLLVDDAIALDDLG
ncbi:hypothetical protein KKF91_19120 [Myxococcota bacterium]|nr:hypothetical protein [Myxococcota bacterium]MBU1432657.1 hypothetical protein [Myxococcota bacterium]MBU1897126.1 hypothetical protein [Myxococcota bacterium]